MTDERKPVTLATLRRMKAAGEKIVMLTAYDAVFAGIADRCGVDIILTGDSLGMVMQGRDTTIPVTVDDIVYHTSMVSRGAGCAWRMADMPFLSYATLDRALTNAGRLMQEGGAHMIKLEGGVELAPIMKELARSGVPVCAHLGLLPQTVYKLGSYKVQGRDPEAAQKILDDALRLQDAGADMVLVECIASELGTTLAEELEVPVIGIGAGPNTDAQVLVVQDVIGITPRKIPKFAKNFLPGKDSIEAAIRQYVEDVKAGVFPGPEHSF